MEEKYQSEKKKHLGRLVRKAETSFSKPQLSEQETSINSTWPLKPFPALKPNWKNWQSNQRF